MRILDGVVIATFAAAGLVSIGLTRWGTSAEPDDTPLRFSLAFRTNGSFEECADYVATPIAGGSAREIANGLVATYERRGAAFVRLEKPCSEHFANRKPFGVCEAAPTTNHLGELSAAFLHYDGVTPRVACKRDCLAYGGSWRPLEN